MPDGRPGRVLVVGASTAGLATVEALRAEGFDGSITLLGAETHEPYRRPMVSKQLLLGTTGPTGARLVTREQLATLGVGFHPGRRATGLDVAARVVRTDRGDAGYDALVITTGAQAHRPSWAGAGEVHVLRGVEDAARLARALVPGATVTVVGGGVLGSEVAASAVQLGASVTLVAGARGLTLGATSAEPVAARLLALHAAAGVRVITGAEVVSTERDGEMVRTTLADGSRLSSTVVVAATGSRPATGWLAGSGLLAGSGRLGDGALTADGHGRVAADVWAAGDVAAWRDPLTGRAVRNQHLLTAMEQGQALGRLLAGGGPSPWPVPFFWTDVHGERLQAYGRLALADAVTAESAEAEPRGTLYRFQRGEQTVGLLGWSAPRTFRRQRAALAATPALAAGR